MRPGVHHSAICVGDLDASLRFYTEGLGLEVLMDRSFDGDWPTLFGARSTRLRSIFLGDRARPDSGIVELVQFDAGVDQGPEPGPEPGPEAGPPTRGFLLLSFFVDVDDTLERLASLGHRDVRRIDQPAPGGSVAMAVLEDPDGVRIELVDAPGG
jgi:glyoxylase I family protein